jgi:hypothetical protein
MKQFQKYGVAAAVASVAAGAVAQEMSSTEAGDLAIIPYYTVLDGKNTGMHIINTTDSTQVVKVRLRRGADSKDALDFNLVMSPRDEWTANIGAGGSTGVQVSTNDSTCTVPAFDNGVAQMPDTYALDADGNFVAQEGYVEIIAMAQPVDGLLPAESQHIAIAAKHQADTGMPLNCDIVRGNFFRVAGASVNGIANDASNLIRGTHTSGLVSSGFCGAADVTATNSLCTTTAQNLSFMGNSDDNALKVSYFITDSDGGLEAGDNAVHVSGFADAPMMTNQQPLSFGTAGILQYDPLNFELPNLAYGAYRSSNTTRQGGGADGASSISSGDMFDGVRSSLQAQALINDWAAFTTDAGNVAADWVVTLPGQYTMLNPLCDAYDAYTLAAPTAKCSATARLSDTSADELPLILASSTTSNPLAGGSNSNLQLWDREEMNLNPDPETPDSDLGFSPGGSAGDPTQTARLNREVNVLMWNDGNVLGTADLQDEDFGLGVIVEVDGADRGWAELTIDGQTSPGTWNPNNLVLPLEDDENLLPAVGEVVQGQLAPHADTSTVAVVGIAVWERQFEGQSGNYGRIVEHSTIVSSGNTRY